MKFTILALAATLIVPAVASPLKPLFQIQLYPSGESPNLRICGVFFMPKPPPKKLVDETMEQALSICRAVDRNHDLMVSTGSGPEGEDTVEDQTYAYIGYEHKTGKIKRILKGHMWDAAPQQ